jgi:hypothetical protein
MLSGVLRGMGREEKCIVSATEVSLPGIPSEYTKCSIHQAPSDLPEGHYEVEYEGRIARIQKFQGMWVTAP